MVSIRFYERFSESPAVLLDKAFIDEHDKLKDPSTYRGWFSGGTDGSQNVIVGVVEEKAVGFIRFYKNTHEGTSVYYYIAGGYVKPEYRRNGLYDTMFKALVEMAKKNHIRYIESSTLIENKAIQSVFEKQGRIATTIGYSYNVDVEQKYEVLDDPTPKPVPE